MSSQYKKSILTRDNLLHNGWKGPSACLFCSLDESIDHLLLHCPVAKFLWGIVVCATGIKSLPSAMDKISDWIYSFPYIHRKILFIGVAALC